MISAYEKSPDKIGFGGCLVRVAGHDFMDFRLDGIEKGGSDGCINFKDEDNAGLSKCILAAGLPEIFEEFCSNVSLADFLVIAAEAVMGRTATHYDSEDYYANGTYAQKLRDNFKFGRITAHSCSWNKGLMPDPTDGCDDL